MFPIPMKYTEESVCSKPHSDSEYEEKAEPPSMLPAVVTGALCWLVDSIQIQVSFEQMADGR